MDFLKNNRRFDFLYGGTPFSELYDACISLPLPHEEPLGRSAYQPKFTDVTAIYAPIGSTWSQNEFCAFPDRTDKNKLIGQISLGECRTYATSGGRSSEQNAPFFNAHQDGKGYIFAIGWTGQWNCLLERTSDDIIIKTKIEDTHFRLLPGEKIRTSSFVLMPYEGTVLESHNRWRRLVREYFSLIGKEGRDAHGPLCAGIWGGMRTASVLERIGTIRENKLPFEYIWMDAGWYGGDTQPSPDEFEGDWATHTGDWRISPYIHPGGLKDVSAAIHEAEMKFLLWVEPERVRKGTPIVAAHPEYFIFPEDETDVNLLLDLGNEKAWNDCFQTLSHLIEEVGIDCYRQDFNLFPLPYWRKNDAEDRKGISEIRHITGMYRLWDALLEKFPHLLIDNCASGGRRIDIETLRRSVPLWRSDFQCPANFRAEGSQNHNLSFNAWMPFSGTGSGRPYDTYRIRSSYSPALTTNYSFSERESFGDDPEKMAWLRKQLGEYLKVRPYMSEDFYPLTEVSDRTDIWSAVQFDRPEHSNGIVQIFRRENSPYETARFMLYGIDSGCSYVFTDADSAEEIQISGDVLVQESLCVTMREKRSSKLYFYKKQ